METVVTIDRQTAVDAQLDRYFMDPHPQQNGDYEVHRENCPFLLSGSRDLGHHRYGHTAMVQAKKIHPFSNGCLHCSREIHSEW